MSDVLTPDPILRRFAIRDASMVTLPSGLKVPRPSQSQIQEADKITRRQERLYAEWCRQGASEEQQGRAKSLERQIAELELKKHPLCRVWNRHLL